MQCVELKAEQPPAMRPCPRPTLAHWLWATWRMGWFRSQQQRTRCRQCKASTAFVGARTFDTGYKKPPNQPNQQSGSKPAATTKSNIRHRPTDRPPRKNHVLCCVPLLVMCLTEPPPPTPPPPLSRAAYYPPCSSLACAGMSSASSTQRLRHF